MKKTVKTVKLAGIIILAVVFVLSVAACSPKPHTHIWGKWQQSASEHWRVCTASGCNNPVAEQRDDHDGSPCTVCGPAFSAVAFHSPGISDQAHVSFANEANTWFTETARSCNFIYETTSDWSNLNDDFLAEYDLVMFLDNLPGSESQREAFQRYIDNGGAWMGFHVSAFTQNSSRWSWYHDEFLGSGNYARNTWAPTSAVLKVETFEHPATQSLPETFESQPNEWYAWQHDLRENPDITILASIDPSSFPLGTGTGNGGASEVWQSGYFPVVWSNNNYKMMYINMGHNLVNYSNGNTLSFTFGNETQNRLVIDGMFGLTR